MLSTELEVSPEMFKKEPQNQTPQTRELNITIHRKSTAQDNFQVRRWLKVTEFEATDLQLHKRYVVFNALEEDVPRIIDLLKNRAFYVDEIHDLHHLPRKGNVLVVYEIDCTAAMKHLKLKLLLYMKLLKTLRLDVNEFQFLTFESDKLFRIIPEQDLLNEDFKLIRIAGLPADGKSSVLKGLIRNSSMPVCLITARELITKLPSVKMEGLSERILNELVTSKFNIEVLTLQETGNLQLVVLVDDDIVSEKEERILYKIFEVMCRIPNLRVVHSTNVHNRARLQTSHIFARLLSLSRTDIVNLLSKGLPPNVNTFEVERLFRKYESRFIGMPALIWTVVIQLYKEPLNKYLDYPDPNIMELPMHITAGKIYEKFLELCFQSFRDKVPELKNNYSDYLFWHMLEGIAKVDPDFNHTIQRFHIVIKTTVKYDLVGITGPDFAEYLVDLYSLRVLCGNIGNRNIDFEKEFHAFFIKRYIKSENPGSHLNEMLGYGENSVSFKFDVRQFDLLDVILKCKTIPNICRILFESFLKFPNEDTFSRWCNSDQVLIVNIPELLGFVYFQELPQLDISTILLIVSAHLGFYVLFSYLITHKKEKISLRDIRIRERQSFRSWLHVLMYMSHNDDITTLKDKKSIINLICESDPNQVRARDYYGNPPTLECNANFELVKYLVTKGARLEDTDFTGCDILDKNSRNPAFEAQLRCDIPEIYERHVLRLNLASLLPVPNNLSDILHEKVTLEQIDKGFAESEEGRRGSVSPATIANHVRLTLTSGTWDYDFESFLLRKLFKTHKMAFQYPKLCNIVNTHLHDIPQINFEITPENRLFMCQRDSPFIVACLNGHINIAKLLIGSIDVKGLKNLTGYDISVLFQALNEFSPNDLLLTIARKLKNLGLTISCYPFQQCLVLGSLNLFKVFTKYLLFTKDRWSELKKQRGFGVLHHVLENSMHDSNAVIKTKKLLISHIVDQYPETLEERDDQGRTAFLLERSHYQLVRHMIESLNANVKSTDYNGNNILNACLRNIINYSEYLGESLYDENFCIHSHVIYLANKKVDINELANQQIQRILQGAQELLKIKRQELNHVGFILESGNIQAACDSQTETMGFKRSVICSKDSLDLQPDTGFSCGVIERKLPHTNDAICSLMMRKYHDNIPSTEGTRDLPLIRLEALYSKIPRLHLFEEFTEIKQLTRRLHSTQFNHIIDLLRSEDGLIARLSVYVKSFLEHMESLIQRYFTNIPVRMPDNPNTPAAYGTVIPYENVTNKKSFMRNVISSMSAIYAFRMLPQHVRTRLLVGIAGSIFMSYEKSLMVVTGSSPGSSWISALKQLAVNAANMLFNTLVKYKYPHEYVTYLVYALPIEYLCKILVKTLFLEWNSPTSESSCLADPTVKINGCTMKTSDFYSKAGVAVVTNSRETWEVLHIIDSCFHDSHTEKVSQPSRMLSYKTIN